MQSTNTTPPVGPASAEDVRAVHDALGDLFHLVQHGAAGDDSPRVLERYHRAIAATTAIAASSCTKENGAPRGECSKSLEARPSAGALARAGDPSEEQSRHPDLNRRPADYESAGDGPFSPRAQRLAALAWDLVDRDPQLAARVAFDVLELDEHDPVACTAVCCNSPLALEVRP